MRTPRQHQRTAAYIILDHINKHAIERDESMQKARVIKGSKLSGSRDDLRDAMNQYVARARAHHHMYMALVGVKRRHDERIGAHVITHPRRF